MPVEIAVAFAVAVAAPSAAVNPCAPPVHGDGPPNGVVPNQKVALDIARTYPTEIFGADLISHEAPLKARLSKGVWFVRGSLPPGWKGGVGEIEICKSNGRVLSLNHGK